MKKHLLPFITAVVLSTGAFAQLTGWSNAMPITVSNTATTSIVNYQLKININTQSLVSASQMLASGDDIRFGKYCDGSTLYNYWIESGMNTASTNIWVKIDTIPANTSRTFFMFYGNASATAVSSIPSVFIGPVSATDSVSGANTGGVTNSQRGFRFSPNEDILVTQFGKNEPTGSTRYVTLFDFSSQAILSQNQVSGPAAQYSYSATASPLWLTQGTQYILEIYQGNSDGYYFGAAPQINPHLTFYDMRYCNSCGQNTFPTNSLSGMHYGYVDLMFYIKNNVSPAPTYTANQGPLLAVAQSTASICPGQSVTFTASSSLSGMTFTWQPSGTVSNTYSVAPTSSTVYTVSGAANIAGCSANTAATTTVAVNVYPTPTVAVSGNNIICGAGSNTLTASGASTYAWNTGDLTASAVVTPTATTVYTVAGVDANGCTGSTAVTVTVSALPSVAINGPSAVCIGSSEVLTASGATTYTWSTGVNTTSISVSPTVATDYTLTGTDANGCVNDFTVTIGINNLPVVSASSNTTQVCAGKTATLSASGASTYTWSTGATTANAVVSPTATSVYTVTGTDANGCSNTATQSLTVNPLPVVNAVTSNTQICAGQTATLTASGASTYSWSTTQTTAGITVTPSVTTTYTVSGTNANGCKASATVTQNVLPCTGVEELNAGKNIIMIYPNPTSGQFMLETNGRTQIEICNLLGAVILTETFDAGKHSISLAEQANGVYYIKARQNNHQQILKVVKQ
ncbi:MAG: DUF2341 domain-containing protein [Bacteroidetes bacterium]|nr:DUF2341 domain-containing protein [Bacteroidota bacterium]